MKLSTEEAAAVRALQRLARRWPGSLWLFSAAGKLHVMKLTASGDRGYNRNGGVDSAYHTGYTIDIPNDGGDW